MRWWELWVQRDRSYGQGRCRRLGAQLGASVTAELAYTRTPRYKDYLRSAPFSIIGNHVDALVSDAQADARKSARLRGRCVQPLT